MTAHGRYTMVSGMVTILDGAEVGRRLRVALDAAGISQRQLSYILGVTEPTISQWLSGQRPPSMLALQRAAVALGTSAAAIMSEDA